MDITINWDTFGALHDKVQFKKGDWIMPISLNTAGLLLGGVYDKLILPTTLSHNKLYKILDTNEKDYAYTITIKDDSGKASDYSRYWFKPATYNTKIDRLLYD